MQSNRARSGCRDEGITMRRGCSRRTHDPEVPRSCPTPDSQVKTTATLRLSVLCSPGNGDHGIHRNESLVLPCRWAFTVDVVVSLLSWVSWLWPGKQGNRSIQDNAMSTALSSLDPGMADPESAPLLQRECSPWTVASSTTLRQAVSSGTPCGSHSRRSPRASSPRGGEG